MSALELIDTLGMLPDNVAYDSRNGEIINNPKSAFTNNLNMVNIPASIYMCGREQKYYNNLPDMLLKVIDFHKVMTAVTAHPKYLSGTRSLDLIFFDCYYTLFPDAKPHDHANLSRFMGMTSMMTMHTYNKLRMPYITPNVYEVAVPLDFAIDSCQTVKDRVSVTTEEFLALDRNTDEDFDDINCLNIYTPANYDHGALVEKIKEINLPIMLSLVL